MKLVITGRSSKISHEEIERAARFYASKLLRPSTINKLYLEIDIKNIEKGYMGFCEWIEKNHRPKDFIITLNRRISRNNILRCLAHEIVHMWQYATGKLFDYIYGTDVKFDNQRYNTNTVDYKYRPWELQAYGLQDNLLQEFLQDKT